MDNLYSSFYLYKKYEIIGDELIDLGITSIDADGTQEAVVKEECDPACGCPEPIYRWVQTEDTVCIEVITYKLQATYSDSSTLNVECDGSSTLLKSQTKPSGYTASAMTSAIIGDCVTTIGDSYNYTQAPFMNCYSLSSVTIPSSVTTIGMYTFYGCSGLTSITIPSGVTSIYEAAFSRCSGLAAIYVEPTTPPTLYGSEPFWNTGDCPIYVPCESVEAYKAATNWSDYASRIEGIPPCGQPTPTIDGKFKLILSDSSVVTGECDETSAITSGEVASQYSGTVVSAVISDCVTSISGSTFNNCRSLSSVTIPNSVTTIGGSAFLQCHSLTSVEIPSGVTSIGYSAFLYCHSLTSVNIPTGVTTIESSTFNSCGSLSSVTIPSSVTNIDRRAFYYCSGLTSVTIPSGVTSIGDSAFYKCSGLTSITCLATTPPTLVPYRGRYENFLYTNDCPIYVPCESVDVYKAAEGWSDYSSRIQALTTPGDYDGIYRGMLSNGEFYHILRITGSKLTSGNVSSHREDTVISNIGTGVTEIDDNTFSGFTMLKEANIASTVTSIGNNAFKDCPQMNIIRVNATTPPTLGSNAFDGTNNCLIQVPCGYASTYRAASGWSAYASRII